MNIKQKFNSIDQSKLDSKQVEILKNIEQKTDGFKTKDKEIISKIDTALDKIISALKDKNPEAIKTKTTSKTKSQKSSGGGKRTLFSIAKDIRKSDETWEEAKNRAKKIMEDENKQTTQKMKSETEKLLAFIKRKKELDGLSGTSVKKDSKIEALPKGRRVSKKGWKNQYGESEGGRVYYENRDNRTDRLAPSFADKIYLAEGGGVGAKTLYSLDQIEYSVEYSDKDGKTYNETFKTKDEALNGIYELKKLGYNIISRTRHFKDDGTFNGFFSEGGYANKGVYVETLDEEIDLSDDAKVRARKTQQGSNKSYSELREKHGGSPEALAFANGGYVVIAKSEKGGGFVMSKPTTKAKAEKLKSLLPKINGESNEVMTIGKASKLSGLVGKEYLKYADGGNVIDAFQMRTVRGVDSQPTEVLTNEQKVEFANGGGVDNDITNELQNFDIENLDPFEKMQYNQFYPSLGKVGALQVLINNVEGDYSQLSEELSELAEKQMSMDDWNESTREMLFERDGYANGGTLIGVPQTPLARGLDIDYTGLVGETGGMSAGEMFAEGGSLGNHGLKQGDQIIKTMSGGVQKIKTKDGQTMYVDLASGYRGAEPPLPFDKGGKLTRIKLGDTVRYKDEAWYLHQKKGVVGIVNMKQGAWGSDFPFIPLSKIDIERELKDFYGNPIKKGEIPYLVEDFAKGGGVGSDSWYDKQYDKKSLDYVAGEIAHTERSRRKFKLEGNEEMAKDRDEHAKKLWEIYYKKRKESKKNELGGNTGLPAGMYADGGYTNERRHVNKSQDYEVRYAKNKPNRAGYLGKRSFDEGGISNGRYEVVKVIGFDKNGKTLPKNEIKVIADFDSRKEALNFVYEQQFKKDVTQRDIFIRDTKTNKTFAEGGFMTDPNFGDFQNQVYATGGGVGKKKTQKELRKEYLEKLGSKEADVWDKIGAESGSQIRNSDKMLKAYAEGVEEMLQKEGVGKGSFDQEDYDFYTDENWHLFNEFLVWNGYYEPEMTKTEKAWREDRFKDPKYRNYVSNPSVITIKRVKDEDRIELGYGFDIIVEKHSYTNGKSTYGAVLYYANKLFKFFAIMPNSSKKEAINNVYDYIKTLKVSDKISENSPKKGDYSVYYNDRGGEHRKTFDTKFDAQEFINMVNYLTENSKSKSGKYIVKADIKEVKVKTDAGYEYTFKGSDVLNGVNILEKGSLLKNNATYVAKRNIMYVELKNGERIKPANGYWIKKDAKGELFKPEKKEEYKVMSNQAIFPKRGAGTYWYVENSKGQTINNTTGKPYKGKEMTNYYFLNEEEAKKFAKKLNNSSFEGGGKTTFKEKATAIAKKFEGKKVEPKYQKEYGKTYDKAEAKEVGNKIAGSQKAKYDSKIITKKGFASNDYDVIVKLPNGLTTKKDFEGFSKEEVIEWCENRGWKYNNKAEKQGGYILKDYEFFVKTPTLYNTVLPNSKGKTSKGGSTKRGGAMQLAKQIRKEGESWQSALKRANEQMRNK